MFKDSNTLLTLTSDGFCVYAHELFAHSFTNTVIF